VRTARTKGRRLLTEGRLGRAHRRRAVWQWER
jgi:hypothetical protein